MLNDDETTETDTSTTITSSAIAVIIVVLSVVGVWADGQLCGRIPKTDHTNLAVEEE